MHLFEETSGSTSAPRLVPYTRAGLAAFQRALHPWLDSLLQARPGIARGRAYWSISPAAREPRVTSGGIPLGMANDAMYFGTALAGALTGLLAVPPDVGHVERIDAWQYLTLRHLLDADDLTLVSVWSPTFFLELLRALRKHREQLCADIAAGVASMPAGSSTTSFEPRPERAAIVRDAVSRDGVDTARIWPHLDTVSCWTHASSRHFSAELASKLPHAYVEGKGLLATEGVISIPIHGAPAPVLAIESGFYEFLDEHGQVHICTEIEQGRTYEVVLTTASGLYRYRLGDRVSVRGWLERTPQLEFVGRAGVTSDLCGEKLCEGFVLALVPDHRGFAMLAPSLHPAPHYRLFVDAERWTAAEAEMAAARLDKALQANPQYRYARRLGQLGKLSPMRVHSPWTRYRDHMLDRGLRLGDIKPTALNPDPQWAEQFAPADAETV